MQANGVAFSRRTIKKTAKRTTSGTVRRTTPGSSLVTVSWDDFGIAWRHLGGFGTLLENSLGVLGWSWEFLWRSLGASWAGLGRSWASSGVLGLSWGDLGRSWGLLGSILETPSRLERSWFHLGSILGDLGQCGGDLNEFLSPSQKRCPLG